MKIKRLDKHLEDSLWNEIKTIIQTGADSIKIRELLQRLEKEHPNELFIKTHLCEKCDTLNIEVWFKNTTILY